MEDSLLEFFDRSGLKGLEIPERDHADTGREMDPWAAFELDDDENARR
jgi:hypothetical protein